VPWQALLDAADVDRADLAGARVVATAASTPAAASRAALAAARDAGAATVYDATQGAVPAEVAGLCDVVVARSAAAAAAAVGRGARAAVHGPPYALHDRALAAPAVAGPVVDLTGASDAFAGALAHFLAAGRPLAAAAAAAAECAARAARKRGGQHAFPAADDLAPPATPAPPPPAAPPPPSPPRRVARANSAASLSAMAAAARAVDDMVASDMILGVGTGATVNHCLALIVAKLRDGRLRDVLALPTSDATTKELTLLDIPCLRADADCEVDLALGGCDAVDAARNVVKGGKGALLREKVVRDAAATWVVVCDEAKVCARVGATFPIPVEVAPACWQRTLRKLGALPTLPRCDARLRRGNAPAGLPGCAVSASAAPYATDNGNYVVDLFLDAPIADVAAAASDLSRVAGVVEHGLFPADNAVGAAHVLVGRPDGSVYEL